MRVTDRMIYDSAALNAGRSRDRAQAATDEVSSGMRVNHPGDDPAAAGIMVKGQQSIARLDAIGKNAARAGAEIDAADTAFQNLSNVLTRASQLAVQLGNDSYSASERANAASEVDELTQQAISLMNTQVNGRYIFGGDQDQAPPFDAAGNYTGDTTVRQVEVAPGVLGDASVRADIAVKGVGGGVDLFATLQSLKTALNGNNGAGIRGAITDLTTVTHQVSTAEAKVGSMGDMLQTAQTLAASGKTDATKMVAAEGEADTIDSASKLALANSALNATLTAASQSFKLSLVDIMQ
jgi:flagellar hook-associated protein 3 FlgL